MAGRRRARRLALQLPSLLRAAGFDVEPRPTQGPGDATRLAREAVEAGAEVAFALGGDGTQRETARGLLGSSTTLGILAAGTANVLPRALGLPAHALRAAEQAGALRPQPFDVGLCAPEADASREEPFLMMCSAGLDGHILAQQNARLKAAFGAGGLLLRGLLEWGRYSYAEIEVEVVDQEPPLAGLPATGSFAAVCNIPLYGGPFRLAPRARPDDGLLDLVLLRQRDRWSTLKLALATVLGVAGGRPGLERATVREVRLRGPEGVRLQLDGDPLSWKLPVRLRIAPAALQILMPASRLTPVDS